MTTFLTLQDDLFEMLVQHAPKVGGVHSGSMTTRLKRWVNSAVRDIETRYLFPELQESYEGVTVADTESYSYPSDYYKTLALRIVDSAAGTYLTRIAASRFDKEFPHSTTSNSGCPSFFVEWDSVFSLSPIPDAIYTYYLRYWKITGDMVLDAAEPLLSGRDSMIIPMASAEALAELGEAIASANMLALGERRIAKAMREVQTEPGHTPMLGGFSLLGRSNTDIHVPLP